ncbi:hypothetical protein [Mycolicibacterium goodii]|nr:hypothetical protein [Mycolicibacterium goodii]MBU8839583.1 hypothetical protein [Mycolicibacterium goodii]
MSTTYILAWSFVGFTTSFTHLVCVGSMTYAPGAGLTGETKSRRKVEP